MVKLCQGIMVGFWSCSSLCVLQCGYREGGVRLCCELFMPEVFNSSFLCHLIEIIKVGLSQQYLMISQATEPLTETTTYKQSRYRWVNFGVYMLAAIVNSLPTQTFSSINTLVSENFNYDPVMVTLNVLFFPIFHPIFAFPANWILDKFGMKLGCIIGGVLLIAGAWMRTLIIPDQIYWCLSGSALAAIGNIFILNSPSILANNWFKPASIPGIISVAVLASMISVSLGSALPGLMVKKVAGDTIPMIQQKIKNFFMLEAIIITVPMILLFIALRNRPEIPPSKAAQNQQKNEQNYIQSLKKLFKNKEYLKIMLVMTFSYGSTTSYLANLDQTLSVIGIENSGEMTAQILISAMLAGLASSFLFIKKVKTTLQYKSIMSLCLLGAFIMFTILQIILLRKPPYAWVSFLMGACTGFFLIPITALLMAYSSEVVYPLGQGSATGYLFAASQTFGFVFGIGSAALISSAHSDDKTKADDGEIWKVYLFMGIHAIFFLSAFLMALLTKNQLNRTKYELGRIQAEKKETSEGLIFSSTG